jgi:hypothetical protein
MIGDFGVGRVSGSDRLIRQHARRRSRTDRRAGATDRESESKEMQQRHFKLRWQRSNYKAPKDIVMEVNEICSVYGMKDRKLDLGAEACSAVPSASLFVNVDVTTHACPKIQYRLNS